MQPVPLATSVYVHFPWCLHRCGYCDFATRAAPAEAIPHAAYAEAVCAELAARQVALQGRQLVSVFFGGGTPSLWQAGAIEQVLCAIHAAFAVHADEVEVTLEANPTSLSWSHAAALRDAGVNRLSVGVQSLQASSLQLLERQHLAEGALAAVRAGAAAGLRVSADLLFGLPDQSLPQLLASVDTLLAAGARHLSLYALTIEPGTPFFRRQKRGQLPLASEDAVAEHFLAAQEALPARGLMPYEVSNYAMAKETARHNQHTWRGGDSLGLGAAAVGCLSSTRSSRRWRNQANPEAYMRLALAGQGTEESCETLDDESRWCERLMLGLRTEEGVDVAEARAQLGDAPWQQRRAVVESGLAAGELAWRGAAGSFLTVPRQRWLHLDSIIARLF